MEISSSHISVSECKIHENERENSSLITSKPLKKKNCNDQKQKLKMQKINPKTKLPPSEGLVGAQTECSFPKMH